MQMFCRALRIACSVVNSTVEVNASASFADWHRDVDELKKQRALLAELKIPNLETSFLFNCFISLEIRIVQLKRYLKGSIGGDRFDDYVHSQLLFHLTYLQPCRSQSLGPAWSNATAAISIILGTILN